MTRCVAIPLIEGVYTRLDSCVLQHSVEFNGVLCRVLLPSPGSGLGPLEPPHNWDSWYGKSQIDWPNVDWGYLNSAWPEAATIRALGLLPDRAVSPGEELEGFDHAVAPWRYLLRDWLAVLAEGPTDYLKLTKGETVWNVSEYNRELDYSSYHAGNIYEPNYITIWEWRHALDHAGRGDQPPIARALLVAAQRAAAIGNWRMAIIDSATAAEVALTTGLAARLATDASPEVVSALLNRTRMLGPRLGLAKELGMSLPPDIQTKLLNPRNALVHRGTDVTAFQAQAAIAVSQSLIDEYEPLPAHCQKSGNYG